MPDPHLYTIHVPPPEGDISIPVGQQLWIHAAQACTFCCTIGAHFSPSIADIQLSHGNNGPYTAETKGSGMYNTSDLNTTCTASAQGPTIIAKSIQIS